MKKKSDATGSQGCHRLLVHARSPQINSLRNPCTQLLNFTSVVELVIKVFKAQACRRFSFLRRYMPTATDAGRSRSPFTISGSAAVDNFVVHFHKRSHSLSLEIYAALEHPTRAPTTTPMFTTSAHRHPKLKVRLFPSDSFQFAS